MSFISNLKGGSLQSFLEAHEQITLSLMDALRDVRVSYYLNDSIRTGSTHISYHSRILTNRRNDTVDASSISTTSSHIMFVCH